MKACKIALFGHRELYKHNVVEERLYSILRDLMQSVVYMQIYIGRNGEFDCFAASVVKRAQNMFGNENSELILVLPYSVKDIQYYEKYYDAVIIPKSVEKIHPKGAITQRNRWMIEECDLFVCYVDKNSGGAYTALEYAKKMEKKIINLALEENEGQA